MGWMLEMMSIAYGCKPEVMNIACGMYVRGNEDSIWNGCYGIKRKYMGLCYIPFYSAGRSIRVV